MTLTLGARVRWARKRAGLSQVRLAEAIGTSQRHIVRWEKGEHKPGPVYIGRLAEATGQPESLFEDEQSPNGGDPSTMSLDDLLRLRIREIVREEVAA